MCSTQELVEPFIVLQRLRACFEFPNTEGDEVFVSRHKSVLYTLEASMTRNREKSFSFLQGLSSNVVAASRAFSKELSGGSNAELPLELCAVAAEIKLE